MQPNPVIESMVNVLRSAIGKLAGMPIVWVVVVLTVVVAICRAPAVKGWLGEKLVSLWLRLFLSREQYTVINDVTISRSHFSHLGRRRG